MSLKVKERRRARFHAIQALYQREMTNIEFSDLKIQFHADNVSRHVVEWDFFNDLLSGVQGHHEILDQSIKPLVSRDFSKINPIELAILRLGAYEILYRLDIPYQVIVNEYVDHAKSLGAEEGHRFVNGLLDKLARKVREI
jgi:transcription antitermination protein NusB